MTRRSIMWGLTAGCLTLLSQAEAQSVRSLINGGNALYNDGKFDEAEKRYRNALERERDLTAGSFNLGNALYRQGKLDESERAYDDVASSQADPSARAEALFNAGNAKLRAQQYQEAVQRYIASLKLKPNDQDAKYNLSYALEKLRQQQEQQQQQQQKQDKNQQQKQDQKDRQNQEQQQNKQQQQQQNQQQDQQQAARQEKRMSRQDAERILEVLKNSERDVQKKLRVRQATRAKTDRDW